MTYERLWGRDKINYLEMRQQTYRSKLLFSSAKVNFTTLKRIIIAKSTLHLSNPISLNSTLALKLKALV
jgi:hypothetical protein